MNIGELIARLFSHYRGRSAPRVAAHDSMDAVVALPLEHLSYDVLEQNMGDPPTDSYDRYRNRMPQG